MHSESDQTPPPGFAATRFVLVEPSHPANVGAAARALKTMGFSRLVLVRPRDAAVIADAQARAMASGAHDVLLAAGVVDDLEQALHGVLWSVALSARGRGIGPPEMTPREAAAHAGALAAAGSAPGEVAFVFGNERVGLSNADVERCNAIAHIPANPAYSSLNLSQAVQVVAYELRLAFGAGMPRASGQGGELAAREEVEQMFRHLEEALVAIGFLDPASPKKLMPRLRRLFARTGLEHEEVNILRGMARRMLLARRGSD
jgi:tRNA/rRNA methyltransferase